jgi:hypothetical protein
MVQGGFAGIMTSEKKLRKVLGFLMLALPEHGWDAADYRKRQKEARRIVREMIRPQAKERS